MLLIASIETDVEVKKGKLATLDPVWSRGTWVTRDRLRSGMLTILGVEELPILLPQSRLAHLVMRAAHEENHDGPKLTLWRSRTRAWVVRGFILARKIEKKCQYCTVLLTRKNLSSRRWETCLSKEPEESAHHSHLFPWI